MTRLYISVCVYIERDRYRYIIYKLLKFRMITGYQINIKINFISFLYTKQNEVLEDLIFNHIKNLKYIVINLMKDMHGFYIEKYKMLMR